MEGVRVYSNASNNAKVEYSALYDIDWTFRNATTRGGTHGIHPYPAKFIPQIPRELIRILHPGNDTAVLDPFCGSGTTIVESALQGVRCTGIDLNPLSCLISKVKVTPLYSDLQSAAIRAIRFAQESPVSIPEIPAIEHWFEEDIQLALAKLIAGIREEQDDDVKDALKVALSSIIVRVSNQESDTRYAAIKKNISSSDVSELFRRAAMRVSGALSSTWSTLFPVPEVNLINKDVLSITSSMIKQPISLVVTSPPYPNAYEYWLYHKYRMYWLGMDPIEVKEKEIGARPHFFKKNPQTADDFRQQMLTVFKLLSQVMIPDGHVCIQVGDSIIRGQLIDNGELINDAAVQTGFEKVSQLERRIPRTRTAFNPKHGRIRKESIYIFRWESN